MRAPVAATPSGVIAFTVAAVPIGMKTGVSITPCAVVSRPRRDAPWRANTSNATLILPSPPAWGEREGTRRRGDGEGEVDVVSVRTSPPHPDPLLPNGRRGGT